MALLPLSCFHVTSKTCWCSCARTYGRVLFSVCQFVFIHSCHTDRLVIEPNSGRSALICREEESAGERWVDMWENCAHFSRACSFICAKARGAVLWEIESARFSRPPNSPANFNTARAAASRWETKPMGRLFLLVVQNMFLWNNFKMWWNSDILYKLRRCK